MRCSAIDGDDVMVGRHSNDAAELRRWLTSELGVGNGTDTLNGDDGDDEPLDGGGDDTDVLNGSTGDDYLSGAAGSDLRRRRRRRRRTEKAVATKMPIAPSAAVNGDDVQRRAWWHRMKGTISVTTPHTILWRR